MHSDVEVVDDALRGLGFTTTRCIERDATYDGIVSQYRGLIEDTASGDAAVVYYSGHGGRQRNASASDDPTAPAWLQYLVPTDVEDRADGRFHAVLAQELSLLQRQLTDKTPNVTTILDCCHSARMSRSPGAPSRRLAPPRPPSRSVASRGRSSDPDGRRSGTRRATASAPSTRTRSPSGWWPARPTRACTSWPRRPWAAPTAR